MPGCVCVLVCFSLLCLYEYMTAPYFIISMALCSAETVYMYVCTVWMLLTFVVSCQLLAFSSASPHSTMFVLTDKCILGMYLYYTNTHIVHTKYTKLYVWKHICGQYYLQTHFNIHIFNLYVCVCVYGYSWINKIVWEIIN